jgi:hypothetical protein
MEIYADGRVVTLDDYRALEIHGGKGGGLRTALPDKGHRGELEVFHAFATGKGPAPMTVDEMVDTTEASFTIRDQLGRGRGPERAMGRSPKEPGVE